MKLSQWIRELVASCVPQSNQRGKRLRRDLVPDLAITRLETRRVLNGDGVTSELVIDAGDAADDGQADSFHIQVNQDQVDFSVNGELIRSASLSELDSITIRGSSDQDSVVADLGDGLLADLNLKIEGGEGVDSVRIITAEHIESLIHAISQPGSGNVSLHSGSAESSVGYQGIEQFDQQLSTGRFELQVGGGNDTLNISDANASGSSQIEVSRDNDSGSADGFLLTFTNPTEQLQIVTSDGDDLDGDADVDQVTLGGLDASFDADFVFRGDATDQFQIVGQNDLGTGDLDATAGNIEVDGSIRSQGGSVSLDSGPSGLTIVRGTIDVSNDESGQSGGQVQVLGRHVGLFDQAMINASGDAAGGAVLIGGDYQGQSETLVNSERTFIGADAVVLADAITAGDGGKVIVWADDVTRFYGTISATGGLLAGDGGMAEVSGRSALVYQGSTDLRATKGDVGTLLLDPKNITVSNTVNATTTADVDAFADTPSADVELNAAVLTLALNSADVVLQANNDITFTVAVNASLNPNSHGLILQAGRSIILEQNLTLNGSFTATANDSGAIAGQRDTGAAAFTMNNGVLIDTNDHNISITMSTGVGGTDKDSGDITLEGLDAGTAEVVITNDGITAGSDILRASDDSLITATSVSLQISNSATNSTGAIGSFASPIRVSATTLTAQGQSGAIAIASIGDLLVDDVDGSGDVSISADNITLEDGAIDAGTGNVSITTTAGSIVEQTENTATKITTSGVLTLSAATGIGATGDGAIDTDVSTLAATTTTSGGIYINETDDLAIDAAGVTAAADGDVAITAGGALTVGSGNQVLGGGNGTSLTLDAASLTLGAGTDGSETIKNTGTGTVALTAGSGSIALDHFAVGGGSGDVSLDAGTQSITVTQATGTAEIHVDQAEISLTAGTIGSATNSLELAGATSLVIDDTAAGAIDITELAGQTIASTSITVGNTGFGTIDVNYNNADLIDINDNHAINSVLHNTSNREFSYTANAGNITLADAGINAGSAAVTIIADAGSISEATAGTATNVTTSGTLTLSAGTGIGTASGDGAIDTNVGTLAATATTSGGIYINETDGIIIGSGAGGVNGLTTQDADITITSGSGTFEIDQAIDAGTETVTLVGEMFDIQDQVQADTIDITASSSFDVGATSQLSSITLLSITASTINLAAGTDGNETLQNSGSGEIALTQTAGDFTIANHAIDGGNGNVTITATAGAILDASDDITTNITGSGVLTLVAATGIGTTANGLDTDVDTLAASTTLSGGIYINEANGLVIGNGSGGVNGLSTATNGDIEVSSGGGTLQVAAVVNAGSGTVTLDAGIGDITVPNASGTAEILSTGTVSLTAAAIGSASNRLEIAGATALEITDTGAGDIYLGETTGNTILATSFTVGDDGYGSIDVDYNNADQIVIGDDHAIDSVQHNAANRQFSYTATAGDITIADAGINAGSAAVTVVAQAGSISESTSGTATNVTTSGVLTLSAATGIGATGDGAIDTDVSTLAATTTTSGGIYINETDDLAIDAAGVTTAADGDVAITAGGALTVGTGIQVIAGGNGTSLTIDAASLALGAGTDGSETVKNTGTGTVTLSAGSGNIALDHFAVGAGSGDVSLDAGTQSITVTQATGTAEINVDQAELSLTAGTIGSATNSLELAGATSLVIDDTAAGAIDITELAGQTIASTSITVGNTGFGTIDVNYNNADLIDINDNHAINSVLHNTSNREFSYTANAGNITLADAGINAGTAAVTIIADTGSISEATAGTATNVTTSGTLTLSAGTGIGTASGDGAIDTNVGTLAATATTSGGIYINENDGIIIGSGAGGVNGLTTQDADITITSGIGTFEIDQAIDAGTETVTLSGQTFDINAAIQADTIDITASGSFDVGATSQLSSITLLSITASTINLAAGTDGNETLQNSGSGEIALTQTAGDFTIANHAIDGGNGNVTITATAGAILDASSGTTTNITGSGVLTLVAATGIGTTTNGLDTDVDTLAASTTLSGGIYINEADGLVIGNGSGGVNGLSTATNGDIAVSSGGGTLQVTAVVNAGSGAVTLDGNHIDIDADVLGGEVTVTAAGSVDVASGAQVIASGTALQVTANDITLGDGSSGSETIRNSGTGTVTLDGTFELGDFSVGAGSGTVTLDAGSGDITVSNASGTAEILSTGTVSLTAAAIGSASNRLEIAGATALEITDTGAGDIYLGETTGNTILATSFTVGDDGYGSIDVDYNNGDQINIGDDHAIDSVQHNAANRQFSYTATAGDITIADAGINAGSAAVTVVAQAGSISESTSGTTTNVTTSGVLTLSAATGIGATGDGAIDTDVGTLAATTTTSGGIYINETDDLAIDAAGVTTATDGDVAITAGGALTVGTGNQVIAGGNGTSLTLDAASLALGAGTDGSETIKNTGTGTVTLIAGSGNIALDHFAVGGGSGDVSLDAGTQSITVTQATGTAEINVDQAEISLTAGTIGSATNSLELAGATSLVIDDTAAGAIDITELAGQTIASTSITVGNTGFGTIDVNYNNADLIDINDNHAINSVLHNTSNREFSYTANAGNITLADAGINAGTAAVTIIADTGSISEATAGTATNVTTSGTLTLSAGTGIGTASGDGAIDTNVGTLAATATTSGGIYINETDGIIIGSGAGTLTGLTTNSADIVIRSGSGTLRVDEVIDAGNGSIQLSGNNLDLNADLAGFNIDVAAINSLDIDANLNAGGNGSVLSIEANSISLADGSDGNETLRNEGTGSISVTSIGGNVTLGDFAIGGVDGLVSIDSAGSILESNTNDTISISTTAQLTLNAQGSIGSGGSGDQPLDVRVGSLNAHSIVSGGIYVNDTGGLTLSDIDTVDGEIAIRSTGAIVVNDIDSSDAVTIVAENGNVTLNDNAVVAVTAVTVAADNGLIEESNLSSNINITAGGLLTLSSATGVGSSGIASIDTDVVSLAAQSTTSGGIYVNESDDLTIGSGTVSGLTTNDAEIIITSGGGLFQVDSAIDAGDAAVQLNGAEFQIDADIIGSDIDLNASGELLITAGSQVIAGGDGTTLTIDATNLTLLAGSAGNATVQNSGTGTIALTANTFDLLLSDHSISGGTGDVSLLAVGSILESSVNNTTNISADGMLVLTAGGAIGSSGGAGINGTGPLDIQATQLSASASGGVYVKDTDGLVISTIQTAGGDIEVRSTGGLEVSNVDAGFAGNVTLVATSGDIVLSDAAITSTFGDVLITATSGSITESDLNTNTNISTAGTLTLSAATGIGGASGAAIDTNVQALAAQTTSSGGIFIAENDGLSIGTGANGVAGLTTAGDGDIEISSGSGFFQINADVSAGGGDIELTGETFDVNADLSGANVLVDASGSVDVNTGSHLIGGGNGTTVSIQAASVTLAEGADGNETVRNTGTGAVEISATSGNVLLPDFGIGTDSGSVSITASAGAILESIVNTTTNVSTSGTLTLSAATGIGTSGVNGAIDTDIGTLAAQTTASGGIYISELNDLTIGAGSNGIDGVSTVGGDIQITAGGGLDVATGLQLVGGGNGTIISIEAASVLLNAGSAGSESILNTGSGSIELTATTGNLELIDHALGTDTGSIAATAQNGAIIDAGLPNETNARTDGTLTLSAATGIGSS
ncbi:hypothetical protein NHH03_01515, partial [Stieleria sp. TO1_6]|uniref:hypothetical protein n=1 Tax=Stieleria tagensis TaxID=2956795 RepID=UPI00209B08C1